MSEHTIAKRVFRTWRQTKAPWLTNYSCLPWHIETVSLVSASCLLKYRQINFVLSFKVWFKVTMHARSRKESSEMLTIDTGKVAYEGFWNLRKNSRKRGIRGFRMSKRLGSRNKILPSPTSKKWNTSCSPSSGIFFFKWLFPWWKPIMGIWKSAIKDWITQERLTLSVIQNTVWIFTWHRLSWFLNLLIQLTLWYILCCYIIRSDTKALNKC